MACYKHRVVVPVVSSLLFTHNPPSVSESITGLYRGQWCDVVVDSALLMQGPRQQGYLGACATDRQHTFALLGTPESLRVEACTNSSYTMVCGLFRSSTYQCTEESIRGPSSAHESLQ